MTECACFEQHASSDTSNSIQTDLRHEADKENRGCTKKLMKNKGHSKLYDIKKGSQTELQRADRWVGEVVSNVTEEVKLAPNTTWTHVIQNVVNCLKSSDTQHFYNLGKINFHS